MYGLYGWLLTKGQIAYLNARYENSDFVAVYPEIYHGNEAGADIVVRYILAKPGEMSMNGIPGPTSFPEEDLIYSFSKTVYETDGEHTLFLPILNTLLFKDQGKKRTKKAVFSGKKPNLNLHPQECIPLDRKFANDQGALADFLNECEVLYSYDHRSAMFEIARLCGCRVVIFPSDYTRDEFNEYEPGMNGISWWPEDSVPLDIKGFRRHYYWLRTEFSRKLNKFIEETQK
jgi:hypothetical protein